MRKTGPVTFVLALTTLLLTSVLSPSAQAADPDNERVSVSSAEAQSDGVSRGSSISNDGRYVAFMSGAANLVEGDTNGVFDIFVRDRQAGETTRVSVDSDGTQGDGNSFFPVISGNGRYVAFESVATNLVDGDTNGASDVFVHDRQTGDTTRVSVSSDGTEGDGASTAADISDDGRYVAFNSMATNLVAGDTNGSTDAFVHDRQADETTRVSVASDGTEGDAGGGFPSLSPDGRFVAFQSSSTNLVDGDTNGAVDAFLHDRNTGETTRVSVSSSEDQANSGAVVGGSGLPDVSRDGARVVFVSDATNLVDDDTNGASDVFVRDTVAGTTFRVSVASDGTQGNGHSGYDTPMDATDFPAIGDNGRFVAFSSEASNLVEGDGNGLTDVFVRDIVAGTTARVSVASDPDEPSARPSLSQNGVVAFSSSATNLVEGDTNGLMDVFARPFREASGYYVMDEFGGIFTFGSPTFFGQADVIDLAATPSGNGYFVLDDVGGIFTFGDATFFGSIPGLRNAGVDIGQAEIIDLAVTPSGQGYYILDAAGGIHTFGDARFFGSIPGLRDAGVEVGPAEGMDLAATPTGDGYAILDHQGGIFTFGDAQFFGSVPALRNAGVSIGQADAIRLAMTATGEGYLVLDEVGGIFTFGDARFRGSLPGLRNAGVDIGQSEGVDVKLTPSSNGYLLLDDVGGIFSFGDARFFGSVPGLRDAGIDIGQADAIRLDVVATLNGG